MEHASEMSRNVSINLYLRPCSIAIYEKFYLYCLYHLRLFWSVNCKTGLWIMYYILEVSKYTTIVYIGIYLVLT